jgi:hypothetical protein
MWDLLKCNYLSEILSGFIVKLNVEEVPQNGSHGAWQGGCMHAAPVAMVEQVGVRQVVEWYVPRHQNDEVAHYFPLSTATSQPLSESRFLFSVLESSLSVGPTSMFQE